jgi:hypothetical protein
MKKSDIKNLVREAVSAKIAKKSLREGAMSDIDIIAQESATFEEFIAKIAAEPAYKSLDANDPEVKEFLQMMYNQAADLSEVTSLKNFIKNTIKEEKRALKEVVEYKNTTTDQFLKMLQQVKQNKLFPNAKWGFARSMGGGTSYLPFDQFVREMTDLIKFRKDHKDPITKYYIWNMEGQGLNYGEVQKVVNGGPDAVLQFAQTQGENVAKINTSWDSEGSQEFAKAMGRGDYGSLD